MQSSKNCDGFIPMATDYSDVWFNIHFFSFAKGEWYQKQNVSINGHQII